MVRPLFIPAFWPRPHPFQVQIVPVSDVSQLVWLLCVAVTLLKFPRTAMEWDHEPSKRVPVHAHGWVQHFPDGDTNGTPDVPNLNPDFKGPVILGVDGYKKTGRYFDPNAFVLPLPGTFGSSPRGFFTGPGLFTLDTSLFKKFSIDEKRTLQFRAEAFNVTNHANFTTPNPAVFSGAAYSPQCRHPDADGRVLAPDPVRVEADFL